jgi:ABC-type transporter Mla subunit MlaD
MSSTKKDDIKESTKKSKESTEEYIDEQNQQIKNTVSNISEATEKVSESVNKFQEETKRTFEKSADTFGKNQDQIAKTSKEITDNFVELQKNVFNNYQSSYLQFLDNAFKSWVDFNIRERYSETYNTLNKNTQEGTVNATKFINEIAVGGVEHFNKLVELTQKYYNDIVQNNLNYVKKIERSYNK